MMKSMKILAVIAALAMTAAPALAQFNQNDIVVGLSQDQTGQENSGRDGFPLSQDSNIWARQGGAWGKLTSEDVTDNYVTGNTAFAPQFLQSPEFDNTGGQPHNGAGNPLACNFGSAWTGFEIYNLATDGSNTWSSLWSVKAETGGDCGVEPVGQDESWSIRGGGLSVSPENTKVAWVSYDGYNVNPAQNPDYNALATGSQLMVLDYNAGNNPGTGQSGLFTANEAMISGPRLTGNGDGQGNAGALAASGPGPFCASLATAILTMLPENPRPAPGAAACTKKTPS